MRTIIIVAALMAVITANTPIGAMAMGNIALIITTTIGIAIGTELLPTEQQDQWPGAKGGKRL